MTRIPLSDESPAQDDDPMLPALRYMAHDAPHKEYGDAEPLDFNAALAEPSRFQDGERGVIDGANADAYYAMLSQANEPAAAAHEAYLELLAEGHFQESNDAEV